LLIKEKKKATFLKNYGYENNFCNENIRRDALSKIDYRKVAHTLKVNMMDQYGTSITNPSQLPEVRRKMSATQKYRMSLKTEDELRKQTENARASLKYVSKQELRVQNILNEMGVTYTANVFLYSYNWDLLLRNKKIIEIQGDFWHANPKMYKETDILLTGLSAGDVWRKDRRKKEKAEKNGYCVYYLWECDLNSISDEELGKILNNILCTTKLKK
jgi:G:T-mismatch repair DNA endonuclease (very short patch repair protein)